MQVHVLGQVGGGLAPVCVNVLSVHHPVEAERGVDDASVEVEKRLRKLKRA